MVPLNDLAGLLTGISRLWYFQHGISQKRHKTEP